MSDNSLATLRDSNLLDCLASVASGTATYSRSQICRELMPGGTQALDQKDEFDLRTLLIQFLLYNSNGNLKKHLILLRWYIRSNSSRDPRSCATGRHDSMSGPGVGFEYPARLVTWLKRDAILFNLSIRCTSTEPNFVYVCFLWALLHSRHAWIWLTHDDRNSMRIFRFFPLTH